MHSVCRAAWQTSSADPSLPVGAAICFSIYKLFDKRKKRAPEGDTSGRSHIWGAVAVTVFGLVLGSLASPSYHCHRAQHRTPDIVARIAACTSGCCGSHNVGIRCLGPSWWKVLAGQQTLRRLVAFNLCWTAFITAIESPFG